MTRKLFAMAGLAATTLVLGACGDEGADRSNPGGSGGTGAAGSAGTAGSGGSGASAGSGGSGAAAGQAGGGGTAGSAGAGQEPDIPMTRSTVPHDTDPNITAAQYETFLAETNAFGLELYQATPNDENAFLSPTSTIVALAMTYAGANGDTATQMAKAMQSSLEPNVFHAAVNKMAMDLASRNIALHDTEEGQKSVRLSLVNGVFAQQDYTFLDSYLDVMSENYDAGVYLLDFVTDPDGSRDTINEWVAFHTEDRIDELLRPPDIHATTRLVLTNALYFYGSWMHAFNEDDTADAPFTTIEGTEVTVPTMHQDLMAAYGEGDGYQIVDLPYDGERVSMTVVLPEEGRFEEIRSGLTDSWLATARAGMEPDSEVALALPKFSFSWGTESFKPTLQSLGMVDAFIDGTADFSGMDGTTDLFIQDVLHQAFVGVDEDGTEAAAATAVVVGFNSEPDPAPMEVDRPFLFFVTDESGAIVFAGQVTDPTAAS